MLHHLRRALCLLACLILLCGCAHAAPYTVSGLFTIDYDESVYTLDNAGYHHESDLPHRWLFTLYSRDRIIDVSIDYEETFAEVNLIGPRIDMNAVHLAAMLSASTEDDVCTHVETVKAADGQLLFNLFQVDSAESGPYLLGETVVNGWVITFYAYYDEAARPVDESLIDSLRQVLLTFQPAW